MQTEFATTGALQEQAGYLKVSGAHLYTVLRHVPDPIARVLLVEPFASERQNSYLPWVRWARHLAKRQIEVLRYDYRGVGESAGQFEEMSFAAWCEDVQTLAAWLNSRPAQVPLVRHGLEIGALLAATAFHQGDGDDTAGDIPNDLLNFINAGGFATINGLKIEQLVERFGLSGVVFVGHCAGAVSALYGAAACQQRCRGLVLLDPYFHITQARRPIMRRNLSEWALRSGSGQWLSSLYDRTRHIRFRLHAKATPRNANLPLLEPWKEVASSGVPILIFKAPTRKAAGVGPRVGEFDYLKQVLQLAGKKSRVLVKLIPGTDHSFASRLGRAGVRQSVERWLANYLPLRAISQVRGSLPEADYNRYHLDCLQP